MLRSVRLALLAAGLGAGAVMADDVLLTNGETFEGVIAERVGDQVRIQLEFGELRMSAASVERIDQAHSPLVEYRARRSALRSRDASAEEWLELARWARSHDLSHGYREALLEAAALDPELEDLAAAMRGIGHVFDDELGIWIPYVERVARVLPPSPREPRTADADRREVEETLSRTVELLALAQLEREARAARESTTAVGPTARHGFPVAHFVGGFVFGPPIGHRVHDRGDSRQPIAPPVTSPDLFRRSPGSLLPVGGANRGTRLRQPGSLLPVTSGRR